MTTSLSPITSSRLEKAATDNGFDQGLELDGDWLVFASTQCPLRIWLGSFSDAVFLTAFSQQNVSRVLLGLDKPPCIRGIVDAHRVYLPWHRAHVFQKERRRGFIPPGGMS